MARQAPPTTSMRSNGFFCACVGNRSRQRPGMRVCVFFPSNTVGVCNPFVVFYSTIRVKSYVILPPLQGIWSKP